MKITLQPIAYINNNRIKIEDDNWGSVISEIKLIKSIDPSAFEGIEAFSHLHIIFYMNKVLDEKAVAQFRHPRNNNDLPKVGTFAQRNKSRPNKLGLTTVELIERNDNVLKVKKLDAINGTPVLDIKPVMRSFLPDGLIVEPDWTSEIMQNYW